MMTDTSSQSAVASAVPLPVQPAVSATDTAVALRSLSHTIGACEFYYEYLVKHILDNPICGSKLALRHRHYNHLATLDALVALAFIWKESPSVSEEDLACAGFTRSFPDGITRHALGSALRNSDRRPKTYQTASMFARRAQRIVKVAMIYGLVEENVIRGNCKPLHATKKLHDLMAEVGSAAAVLMLAPLGVNQACGLARPLQDETGEGAT